MPPTLFHVTLLPCYMSYALSQHQEVIGHLVNASKPIIERAKVLERESRTLHRKVCEAIHIKTSGASLNRNEVYDLPDLYLPMLLEEEKGAGVGGVVAATDSSTPRF